MRRQYWVLHAGPQVKLALTQHMQSSLQSTGLWLRYTNGVTEFNTP
jgi:hypothetical protein